MQTSPSAPHSSVQTPPGWPRKKRLFFALGAATAVVIAGVSAFVLTRPPDLAVTDGSIFGVIRGNFPTISSNDSILFSFNATTYANQTGGPPSTLTLTLQGYAYHVGNPSIFPYTELEMWITATVAGRFASNVRPGAMELTSNGTGPGLHVDALGSFARGTNVSFDRNDVIGFRSGGSGSLSVAITPASDSGRYHDFRYSTEFRVNMYDGYNGVLGFRTHVTGWRLPPIGVAILLRTEYVPKSVQLFESGRTWTLDGGTSLREEIRVYTGWNFTLTGAFTASSGVTAYILNLTNFLNSPDPRFPTAWRWTSGPSVAEASFNVTFLSEWGYTDPYPWYLVFVNPNAEEGTTVQVTDEIMATT